MATRSTTPSFVCEIPLLVKKAEEKRILSRLEAARQLYNACLGEAQIRLRRMRESKQYQAARKLPKKTKERTEAFQACREKFEFSDYAIQSFATKIRKSWIGEHLDSHSAQKIATRAFKAVEKLAFGKARKVRFKGKNQLDSIEGKTNSQGITWNEKGFSWSGLKLKSARDERDPVISYGLKHRVKYVRLVRRKIRGKNYFFAQLVLEGYSYVKPQHRNAPAKTQGIDVGPSTIAIAGEEEALLLQFCEGLDLKRGEIRRILRKMDRQRRASNPQNYNEDGTVKKGKLLWNYSKRYLETRALLAEAYRKQAEYRKTDHGRVSNQIVKHGNTIKAEKLSYRAWQKLFGKSVKNRAPGLFMSILRRKAERAGGAVEEFPTRGTKLSQFDHSTGEYKKKPLSQRMHYFGDGITAPIQRDLYSAFLAKYVEGETLNAEKAAKAFPGAEPLLRAAFESVVQRSISSGTKFPASFGIKNRSQRSSPEEGEIARAKIRDDVGATKDRSTESPEEAKAFLPRTSRL